MLNIKTHAILYLDYAVILDITIILTLHINLSWQPCTDWVGNTIRRRDTGLCPHHTCYCQKCV